MNLHLRKLTAWAFVFALTIGFSDLPGAEPPSSTSVTLDDESTPSWAPLDEFLLHQGESESNDWPTVLPEMRPGAIWWWPNSAVTKKDLSWNLELYRKAGWGNLSIVGIYGVRGEEERAIDLFSPKWFEAYNYTIEEADRLGMNIDLTPGGGWRWGGPHVSRDFAEQSFRVDGDAISVLSKRDAVKRAGKGGKGLTVNPYSNAAVAFHLDWFDRLMAAHQGMPPRAFYYDSFENTGNWAPEFLEEFCKRRGYSLEDQAPLLGGEGDSEESRRVVADYRRTLSELLIDRVREIAAWGDQRGSGLRMQAHGAPANLLDMYAAASIPETEVFGASKFAISGFRRDPQWIRADQQSDMVNRFASSASHVAGHALTTSESFTWLRNHYHTSLAHLKAESDKLLLNGINSIFYHGACFSPEKTAWPGWLFYASTQANPRNSIFRDIPVLNAYITRCQSVLQSGRPHNDVLLYWPVHDLWMNGGTGEQRFTVHHPDWIEKTACGEAGRWLDKHGYTFDFVSDDQLQETEWGEDGLRTQGGNRYRTVLVPAAKVITLGTAKRLIELARDGATVLIWKRLPGEVPGWFDYGERERQLRTLFKEVGFDADGMSLLGRGKLMLHGDLETLLAAAGVEREPMVDQGLQFIRRIDSKQVSYFIANHTSQSVDRWVTFASPCQSAVLMDPMKGAMGRAPLRQRNGLTEVFLQIESGETRILRAVTGSETDLNAWAVKRSMGDMITISGPWELRFIEGGPTLPSDASIDRVGSWTEIPDEEAKRFAGAVRYTAKVDVPEASNASRPDGWILDLGDVRESARVWVNDEPVGVAVAHPFRIDLGRHLKTGENELAIEVTNLSANRIRDLDRRGVDWKKFEDINFVDHLYKPFDASKWSLEASGLLQPVTLSSYRFVESLDDAQ
ncbi:glycosyl hydrolase [Rhodopirellula sp. SWK7]|uniref:glycosyl hydrolase n=1 Tax=Rhodopirellula sp. SWK7 TaxID=595460 RepID=UPI0002BFFCA0|nr:glycosyl hydrolase [Rhodopirellula sp. SWK7]EMI45615.1 glycoside hydrolase family 2 [Rhodopirellula sp. SWK7]